MFLLIINEGSCALAVSSSSQKHFSYFGSPLDDDELESLCHKSYFKHFREIEMMVIQTFKQLTMIHSKKLKSAIPKFPQLGKVSHLNTLPNGISFSALIFPEKNYVYKI